MIQNLSQREKAFLIGGAVALVLLVVVFGMIIPYRSALNNLDEQIDLRQKQLVEVRQLQAEYQRLKSDLSQRERKIGRGGDTSAFAAIESIVTRLGFRDKLVSMRPQPSGERAGMRVETVAARLEKIDLEKLVRLLRALESANTLLNVTSMQARTRFDDRSLLDVELKIETLKQSG